MKHKKSINSIVFGHPPNTTKLKKRKRRKTGEGVRRHLDLNPHENPTHLNRPIQIHIPNPAHPRIHIPPHKLPVAKPHLLIIPSPKMSALTTGADLRLCALLADLIKREERFTQVGAGGDAAEDFAEDVGVLDGHAGAGALEGGAAVRGVADDEGVVVGVRGEGVVELVEEGVDGVVCGEGDQVEDEGGPVFGGQVGEHGHVVGGEDPVGVGP